MNEPIDLPPAPAAKKYTLVDYVFQFITVTAGVLIALMIDGLVDWNAGRRLVADARATIAQEIAANRADLDTTLAGMVKDLQDVDTAVRFANELHADGKSSINELKLNVNLADLSSAGWGAAERTGALGYMPFDEVQRYSQVYDFQDLYVERQRELVSQLSSAMAMLTGDASPGPPNPKDIEEFRDRIRLLRSALGIHADMGKQLSNRYAELLSRGTRP